MKLIFKIVFLLLFTQANAQVPAGTPTVNAPGSWYRIGWVQGENGLIHANKDTNAYIPRFAGTTVYRPNDGKLYYYDSVSKKWQKLSVGSDVPINIATASLTANGNYIQNWNGNQLRFNRVGQLGVFTSNLISGTNYRQANLGTVTNQGLTLETYPYDSSNANFGVISKIGLGKHGDEEGASITVQDILGSGSSARFYSDRTVFEIDGDSIYLKPGNLATIGSNGALLFQTNEITRGAFLASGQLVLFNVNDGMLTDSFLVKSVDGVVRKVALPASATANTNIGTGFRILNDPSLQTLRTIYNSNTILWDSISNTDGLTAKVDTSVIATQYDLTQIPSSTVFGNVGNQKVGDSIQFQRYILQATSIGGIDYPERYISNTGSNLFNGLTDTTAQQTIANIQSDINSIAAYRKQARVAMAANSSFAEMFTTTQNNIAFSAYGLNDGGGGQKYLPVINGADPSGVWTDTASMGKIMWSHVVPTNQGNYHYIFVVEIDTAMEKYAPYSARNYLPLATNLSVCDATPGTFYSPSLNATPIAVYVHPTSGNANSNKYRYEIVRRPFDIDASFGGTVASGGYKNIRIEYTGLLNSGHGYGMVGSGDSINIQSSYFQGGGTHHYVGNSGVFNNIVWLPGPKNLAQGETTLVIYKGQAQGGTSRITNNIFIKGKTALYGHQQGPLATWHKEIMVSGNYFYGDTAGNYSSLAMSADLFKKIVFKNNYVYGFQKAFGGMAENIYIEGNIFNRISERSGFTYPLDSVMNIQYNNNLYIMEGDATGAGMIAVVLNRATFKGKFENNIFRDRSTTSNNSIIYSGVQSSVDQVQSYRNIFITDRTGSGSNVMIVGDKMSSPTPFVNNYKGDYNVYINVRGNGPRWVLLNNGGDPNISTLAQWKLQSGQDQNSIYMDCANYAMGLKQIFVDPDNGNYNLANTPQGDSIRALMAGMLTPPSFFPSYPTYEQAIYTMLNRGQNTLGNQWVYGKGGSSASGSGVGLDTTAWRTNGNAGYTGKFFGTVNSYTIPFKTNSIDRGFLRYNGDWIFGGDSTGITPGNALVTVKGNMAQTGNVDGANNALIMAPNMVASANSQALTPITISPTYVPGAFTGVGYRFISANGNAPSNLISTTFNNTASNGGAAVIVSNPTSSLQIRSDGVLWAPSTNLDLTPAGTSNSIRFQSSFGVTGGAFQNGSLKIGDGTAPTARLTIGANMTSNNRGVGGVQSAFLAATYTDNNTAISGTVTHVAVNAIAQPTLAATNTSVTYTNASTYYLAGAPINGTNVTVTNPWTFFVASGNSRMSRLFLHDALAASNPSYILFAQADSGVTKGAVLPTYMGGVPSGGTTGQVLTKNSNTNYDYSWSSVGGSGVTTIGTINSQTKSTDGAVITGTSLVMQTADASSVGLVSIGAQTFAGTKTFQDGIIGQTSSSSVSKVALTGNVSGAGEPGVFGLGLSVNQYTYTDNGAARTVGNIQQMNKIADPTLAAVNAVTYTTAANLYVMDLTAGSNVTITQSRSIYALGTTYLEQFATGINESASASVSMAKKGLYIATGTTATYTLPDRNAYLGVVYFIKNAGSGDLTVQRAGSDQLYDTSAVNSVVIPAGSARIISAGSNYWYVQ